MRTRSGLLALPAAAAVLLGAGATQARDLDGSGKVGFVTPGGGIAATVRPQPAAVRTLSIRYERGLRIRLPKASSDWTYLSFQLDVGDAGGPSLFGSLRVDSDAQGTSVALRSPDAGAVGKVRGTLRTGSRPSLVLTGFPKDVTGLTLRTSKRGAKTVQSTGCKDRRLAYRGTMTVVLATGARRRGQANHTVVCD